MWLFWQIDCCCIRVTTLLESILSKSQASSLLNTTSFVVNCGMQCTDMPNISLQGHGQITKTSKLCATTMQCEMIFLTSGYPNVHIIQKFNISLINMALFLEGDDLHDLRQNKKGDTKDRHLLELYHTSTV